jgi:hypothetical protein
MGSSGSTGRGVLVTGMAIGGSGSPGAPATMGGSSAGGVSTTAGAGLLVGSCGSSHPTARQTRAPNVGRQIEIFFMTVSFK